MSAMQPEDVEPVTPRFPTLNDINPLITCALCGGYLIDATAINRCLHAFCRACIVSHLQVSCVCPICDVQLNDYEPCLNLRKDHILQRLVYKMVPGLYRREIEQRKKLSASDTHYRRRKKSRTSSPSRKDGDRKDGMQRGVRKQPVIYDESDFFSLSLRFCGSFSLSSDTKQCNDQLTTYLQCPARLTIRLVKKFIRLKFNIDRQLLIEILDAKSSACIPNHYSLVDVAYVFPSHQVGILKLQYAVVVDCRSLTEKRLSAPAQQAAKAAKLTKVSTPPIKRKRGRPRRDPHLPSRTTKPGPRKISSILSSYPPADTRDHVLPDLSGKENLASPSKIVDPDSLKSVPPPAEVGSFCQTDFSRDFLATGESRTPPEIGCCEYPYNCIPDVRNIMYPPPPLMFVNPMDGSCFPTGDGFAYPVAAGDFGKIPFGVGAFPGFQFCGLMATPMSDEVENRPGMDHGSFGNGLVYSMVDPNAFATAGAYYGCPPPPEICRWGYSKEPSMESLLSATMYGERTGLECMQFSPPEYRIPVTLPQFPLVSAAPFLLSPSRLPAEGTPGQSVIGDVPVSSATEILDESSVLYCDSCHQATSASDLDAGLQCCGLHGVAAASRPDVVASNTPRDCEPASHSVLAVPARSDFCNSFPDDLHPQNAESNPKSDQQFVEVRNSSDAAELSEDHDGRHSKSASVSPATFGFTDVSLSLGDSQQQTDAGRNFVAAVPTFPDTDRSTPNYQSSDDIEPSVSPGAVCILTSRSSAS